MDNQTDNQVSSQTMETSAPLPENQSEGESSKTGWYVLGVLVIIVVLALWYAYATQAPPTNLEQTAPQTAPVGTATSSTQTTSGSGTTTNADLQAELNQSSDSSAVLDQAAAASAQSIQGL